MRLFRSLIAACLAASVFAAPVEAQLLTTRVGPGGFGGVAPGTPTGLTITSAIWTSSTDLSPVNQFANGWTADLTLQGTNPAGATSAYATCISGGVATGVCGSIGSPSLSFVDTWPGYDSAGNATTGTSTIYATSWLRQTYNNSTLPTEAANGGNAKIALTLSDFVYPSDTLGTATSLSGLYVSNVTSTATSGIPVANASTRTYPRGGGQWITAPGERIGSGQGLTVEFFGGQQYGQNLKPFAAVKITACDAGCAHSVTKTVSSMSMSAKQLSFSCTATNGSATLTACNSTLGVIDGERFTVAGIPGQPRLLSHTSTSLTFGSAQTCVTTLNSGNVTVNTVGSLAAGDALADGGFGGATLSDVNITGPQAGVANISSETLSADVTMASTKATAAVIHTDATAVTATAAHACTINHVYQGTTGTVTAYVGVPVPVWSATFASGDFSGFSDGVVSFRAQAYPVRGDVVLDTQTGADGSGCDWFYINDTGTGGAGVCDSGNPAWFNTNGTNVSANLHNLWAYLDTAGTYAAKYAWVSLTAGASPAVQSTGVDPGSTAYYASIKAAADALKTAYGGSGANGGVICLLAAGSPYATFGGTLAAETVAAKPRLTITSATSGGTCSPTFTANADMTVTLKVDGTIANRAPPNLLKIANLAFNGDANTIQGSEAAQATAFNTFSLILDNVKGSAANAATVLNKVGVWSIYNSFIDQSANDGRFLQPASSTTGALRMVFGSTLVCGNYTTHKAKFIPYAALGNIGWDCEGDWSTTTTDQIATFTQPVGSAVAYNKWMGMNAAKFVWPNLSNNFLLVENVFELMNTTSVAALQVSGDSANVPVSNLLLAYTTVIGGRTNNHYLEGVAPLGTAVASGGAFAAGTYYTLVSYALKSNPTVETSTDGINGTSGVFSGPTVVLNGSINLDLQCNPNYVATIYVGLAADITGTGSSATLGHYATVGGVDAKQIATCQTVTITAQGSAHTSPSVAGTTGGNMLKTNFFEFANIYNNYNVKGDLFGGTGGQAGGYASGGKVGNWEARFRVGKIGNVFVTGSVIGSGYNPSSGQGEFPGWLESSNPANSQSDISWVLYKSDRSIGAQGSTATTVLSPALNLGQGNYCLSASTPHGLNQVPAGRAQWPFDIQGRARLNDGTGAAGAYERGCI